MGTNFYLIEKAYEVHRRTFYERQKGSDCWRNSPAIAEE